MQKQRNIKLLMVLVVAFIVTTATWYLTRPEDKLDISRDTFAYDNPANIDKVVMISAKGENTLTFERNQWKINGKYDADRQRVSVLFALLKQTKVRRTVAKAKRIELGGKFQEESIAVTFYEGNQEVKSFYVWGDEETGLTYMSEAMTENPYIVALPGYKNYIAGIYKLDESGWRDPLVFKLNWVNLQRVTMQYLEEPEQGFEVQYDKAYYNIVGLQATDSAKLTDFLDDISLLYVNDYLTAAEQQQYDTMIKHGPQTVITVEDVGRNHYTLELYDVLEGKREIIGRIDSTDYAVFDVSRVRKIMRPKMFFQKKIETAL